MSQQAEGSKDNLNKSEIPSNEEGQSLQQIYQDFKSQTCDWWTWAKGRQQDWGNWDSEAAQRITDFKRDYILSIGDMMNRSICMAVTGGITYKLISLNKPSLIRRSRNLAVSFALSGWLFLPQLFNPFLNKID